MLQIPRQKAELFPRLDRGTGKNNSIHGFCPEGAYCRCHRKIGLSRSRRAYADRNRIFLDCLGFNSKAVVTGDITQIDLPDGKRSGLKDAVRVLKSVDDIAIHYLTGRDVVRHRLVREIIKAYERSAEKK